MTEHTYTETDLFGVEHTVSTRKAAETEQTQLFTPQACAACSGARCGCRRGVVAGSLF